MSRFSPRDWVLLGVGGTSRGPRVGHGIQHPARPIGGSEPLVDHQLRRGSAARLGVFERSGLAGPSGERSRSTGQRLPDGRAEAFCLQSLAKGGESIGSGAQLAVAVNGCDKFGRLRGEGLFRVREQRRPRRREVQ